MRKLLLILSISFLCSNLFAQVPATLSYQGILTDTNGNPVQDGSHSILFNFYTTLSGGTADFSRGPLTATTYKGLFTIILGNGQGSNNAALPYSIGGTQYYVGIEADGGTELTPRVSLTAVPYAFMSYTTQTVDASAITAGTISNARLDPNLQDLADGSLSGSKVGSGINGANITSGTIDAARIPGTVGVPVGTIIAYGGATIPSGWLLCDGSAISRTTYSALFNAIGIAWGRGNSTSTFNLPDLRGRFMRGVDFGAGNDPDSLSRFALASQGNTGDKVGSYQLDAFQGHYHTIKWGQGTGTPSASIEGNSIQQYAFFNPFDTNIGAPITDGVNGSPRISMETRPTNAYVNYLIKAE